MREFCILNIWPSNNINFMIWEENCPEKDGGWEKIKFKKYIFGH